MLISINNADATNFRQAVQRTRFLTQFQRLNNTKFSLRLLETENPGRVKDYVCTLNLV